MNIADGVAQQFYNQASGLAGEWWHGNHDADPIIAMHGWLDNAASFAPLAAALGRPLLALDMPGHGLSRPLSPDSLIQMVDYLLPLQRLFADKGWQRCTLLGHSMGAGVATLMAVAMPEQVSRLILLDGLGPLSGADADAPQQLRRALQDQAAASAKSKPVYSTKQQAIAARCRGAIGSMSEGAATLLCERGLQQVDQGWTWRADSRLKQASPQRFTEGQVIAILRAIQQPVCLIVAQQGLGAQPMFAARRQALAEHHNWQMFDVPGGHHMHMDTPDLLLPMLKSFLAV